MSKKLLALGVAAAIALSGSAFANASTASGLTLSNPDSPNAITVFCNSKQGLYPIPAHGTLGPLTWPLITMMFGSSHLQCQFKAPSGAVLGSAVLDVTSTTGEISQVSVVTPNTVDIAPGQGVVASALNVTLHVKSAKK